jgi:hypothetical protein
VIEGSIEERQTQRDREKQNRSQNLDKVQSEETLRKKEKQIIQTAQKQLNPYQIDILGFPNGCIYQQHLTVQQFNTNGISHHWPEGRF